MLQLITRGVAFILLAVATAAISATSAILKLRCEEKSTIGETAGNYEPKAEDLYFSPLDYRLAKEESTIELTNRDRTSKIHLIARDGRLLGVTEEMKKAS